MASLADMPKTNAFRTLDSSWGLIRLKRGHLVTSAMVPLLWTLATLSRRPQTSLSREASWLMTACWWRWRKGQRYFSSGLMYFSLEVDTNVSYSQIQQWFTGRLCTNNVTYTSVALHLYSATTQTLETSNSLLICEINNWNHRKHLMALMPNLTK